MQNTNSQLSKTALTKVKVKICGLREESEVDALDQLQFGSAGIDWIGFNFHLASARYITPEAAAPLIKNLRQAKSVGVFVDAPLDKLLGILDVTGIEFVQLHGNEDWAYIQKIPRPVIKAIPHHRLEDLGGLRADWEKKLGGPLQNFSSDQIEKSAGPLTYFLVDTQSKKTGAFGGSGESFDWNLLNQFPLPIPYFLAGGIGPGNLQEAIEATTALGARPFAVDLNSKVESAPGRKDLEKIGQCLKVLAGH